MRYWTTTCLAALALLAACSHKDDAQTADGSGGSSGGAGYGAGGPGGGANGGSAGPGSQEDLVRSAGDRILFDTDRATLNPAASAILARQAAWLQQNPQVNVWVAGNCDERGTEEYNLALGQRRANADRDYLVAHGVAKARVETISYGKARPVDAGSNAAAWAQNRNAVTSVK
jgi:peptidoglycan-associated lipoprotein